MTPPSDRNDERPQPRRPPQEPTVWLDWETGNGIDGNGRPVEVVLGGRRTRHPILVDLLETARRQHASRLMVCGNVPADPRTWLLPDEKMLAEQRDFLPGWSDEGSYLESPPHGRFRHEATGHVLRLQTCSEWFPVTPDGAPLDPKKAAFCHRQLTLIVAKAIDRDWPLMRIPSQTFLNIWKLRAAPSYDMAPLDPDIGRLIQATEPQHRIELYSSGGRCSCGDCPPLVTSDTIPDFFYQDGRFMFHGAPPKELGAATARRITGAEADDLFDTSRGYHPARYRVRFTVPQTWDTLGLLPVQHEDRASWHWPNRPGATHETWADTAEVRLARICGWQIQLLEGLRFTKANSLQPVTHAITTMLNEIDQLTFGGEPASLAMKTVLAGAVRHMYRVGIGAFSRRPRTITRFAVSMGDVPDDAVGHVDPLHGGFVYRLPMPTRINETEWHPEIAARVWATSRVAVLKTPTASKDQRGALDIDPQELLGIHGDAIYTTALQRWTLPVDRPDGGDDGKSGRIRLKGWLPGPHPTPQSFHDRTMLSREAEAHGWDDLT